MNWALERLTIPRMHLRDEYLMPVEDRIEKLTSSLTEEEAEVEYPDAPPGPLGRMREKGLNPSALFISEATERQEILDLYMPLAAITQKRRKGMEFEEGGLRAFYNDAVGKYLRSTLTEEEVSKGELRGKLAGFIQRAHYAAASASWDGDCRNLNGRATVALFQRLLIRVLNSAGLPWSTYTRGRGDQPYKDFDHQSEGYQPDWIDPSDSGSMLADIHVDDRLTLHFGEPDLTAKCKDSGRVLMQGEIKGRTDLSNLYESWLPTVSKKLEKSRKAHPDAKRAAVQLFVTEMMLSDPSRQEEGLEDMRSSGLMDTAYSLVKLHHEPEERERLQTDLEELLSDCE